MLRLLLGVSRMVRINNEYIRGTAQVKRDSRCIGHRMLTIELPGRRRRGRAKKKSFRVTVLLTQPNSVRRGHLEELNMIYSEKELNLKTRLRFPNIEEQMPSNDRDQDSTSWSPVTGDSGDEDGGSERPGRGTNAEQADHTRSESEKKQNNRRGKKADWIGEGGQKNDWPRIIVRTEFDSVGKRKSRLTAQTSRNSARSKKKKNFLFKHRLFCSFSASLESQASIVVIKFITLEINPIFDTSGALSKGGQAHIQPGFNPVFAIPN